MKEDLRRFPLLVGVVWVLDGSWQVWQSTLPVEWEVYEIVPMLNSDWAIEGRGDFAYLTGGSVAPPGLLKWWSSHTPCDQGAELFHWRKSWIDSPINSSIATDAAGFSDWSMAFDMWIPREVANPDIARQHDSDCLL